MGSSAEGLDLCEGYFNGDESLTYLMAPVVSPQSEERVLKDIKQRSVNDGFVSYFGLDHFKKLMLDEPGGTYRFIKTVELGLGKIQVLLIEGKVLRFEQVSRSEIKVFVGSVKKHETVFLKSLSSYYLLERDSLSE